MVCYCQSGVDFLASRKMARILVTRLLHMLLQARNVVFSLRPMASRECSAGWKNISYSKILREAIDDACVTQQLDCQCLSRQKNLCLHTYTLAWNRPTFAPANGALEYLIFFFQNGRNKRCLVFNGFFISILVALLLKKK
jgi:hypothetical protein